MSKRTMLERLQNKYGSWNNSNTNTSEPLRKKQKKSKMSDSTQNAKQIESEISDSSDYSTNNTNNSIQFETKTQSKNTNNKNKTKKQKISNPKALFKSLTINNFIINGYVAQNIRVLFGTKLITIQWMAAKQKDCKSSHKLYNSTVTKRINIKFDSIEYIYLKYSQIHLKLKYPPYFSEQACSKLMNSGQKSNQFHIIENDPTNGNAMKCKQYKIEMESTVNILNKFMNKLQKNSPILKKAIGNGVNKTYLNDNDITFNSEELKQGNVKIKNKSPDLKDNEMNKILMSLGVKRNECKNVNHCLKIAISKKYIGIKNGKCKLDKNGGLNQKINGLLSLPDCMEITLKRLIDQPIMGDDYECGDTNGAAICIDTDCGGYCGGIMYVTGLCRGKPELDNGKFHNHCIKCKKCMGDYRSGHCYKCGVHDKWMGKCSNCDKSDGFYSD